MCHGLSPDIDSHTDQAQAIKWATKDHGVDILLLPFGYERRVYQIDQALKDAFQKNVLTFSPSSIGLKGFNGTAQPAFQQSTVISVYATDATGLLSSFNPPPTIGEVFSTIGEEVES